MTPNETLETGAAATDAAAAEQHELAHDHDHAHDHTHSHAPALNPDLTREINVEVPADEVDKAYSKVIKRYTKLARIPGFRPGKVPENTIRNRFAKELRQEVLDSLVQERFRTEMESQAIAPVSQPQITELNLFEGQPLRFRAQFEVLPTIDVNGYQGITIEKPVVEVEQSEFEDELARVLDSHATVETVEEDRPLQDGDWAEISFHGVRRQPQGEDGEQVKFEDEDVEGEDILVEIGGKNTLPAFTEALRGKSKGQEFELEVSYPSDFGDVRLAGTVIDYDVTVNAIKKKTYPEKDAEFAKQIGEYETWEQFEEVLRSNVATRKRQNVEAEAKGQLVDKLVEHFQFPVPESFVQQQIDVRLDRGLRALAQQGMTREQMQQLDFSRLREAQREEAVKEVKASLILDKIAEAGNVQVKEDDVERELLIMSIQTREPLETLRDRLKNDGTLQRMREQMRREATATALYEKMA